MEMEEDNTEGELELEELEHDDLERDKADTPKKKRRRRHELNKDEKEKESSGPKRYQVTWEELPLFKGWLKPVPDNAFKAKCIACDTKLNCGKSELEKHASGAKHKKKAAALKLTVPIADAFAARPVNQQLKDDVKRAEIMIAAAFAEHNIAIHIVDHIVPVFQKAAKDSKILKNVTLGRTKCTAIIENVIAKVEVEEVIEDIKTVPLSILIDGSTDNTAHKSLCVLVKYFSPKIKKSIIALLELVELDARDCTAAKQYGALMKCFEVNTNHIAWQVSVNRSAISTSLYYFSG